MVTIPVCLLLEKEKVWDLGYRRTSYPQNVDTQRRLIGIQSSLE
jgi:hypothetical protein